MARFPVIDEHPSPICSDPQTSVRPLTDLAYIVIFASIVLFYEVLYGMQLHRFGIVRENTFGIRAHPGNLPAVGEHGQDNALRIADVPIHIVLQAQVFIVNKKPAAIGTHQQVSVFVFCKRKGVAAAIAIVAFRFYISPSKRCLVIVLVQADGAFFGANPDVLLMVKKETIQYLRRRSLLIEKKGMPEILPLYVNPVNPSIIGSQPHITMCIACDVRHSSRLLARMPGCS